MPPRPAASGGNPSLVAIAVSRVTLAANLHSRPTVRRGCRCYFQLMQASCGHCGTQHVLKDTEVAVHNKVQFHCSKCGRSTVVEINIRPDRTVVMSPLPNFARGGASASHLNLPPADAGVKLPA